MKEKLHNIFVTLPLKAFYWIRGYFRYQFIFKKANSNGKWYYSAPANQRYYHNDGFRFTLVQVYDCGMGVTYQNQKPKILDYYLIGILDLK